MNCAIKLNTESFGSTVEIQDVPSDTMLPSKLSTVEGRPLDEIPEERFSWC